MFKNGAPAKRQIYMELKVTVYRFTCRKKAIRVRDKMMNNNALNTSEPSLYAEKKSVALTQIQLNRRYIAHKLQERSV